MRECFKATPEGRPRLTVAPVPWRIGLVSKLSEDELAEMRQRATQGYASDFGGPIDQERELDPDPMIWVRRSEIY
jgi:hypothetical protein